MIAHSWEAQWERCRDWIAASLQLWDMAEADLLEQLRDGRAQLWPTGSGALITALVARDERQLLIPLVGGKLDEIVAALPGVEAWARSQGAQSVYLDGRRGWRRIVAKMGYAPWGDGMRKAL